ncbi:hypothetical protein SSYIS1_03270 [Serratia symbiotica]|uniref:Uncharacterized protein n=1 Tax=Serratia symbiotica TaxID=138074 RepID=A0A455VKC7_9GAMM|nr:hypothetical protein SSYIS1_03270 [Serratia symbiotica]
MILENNALCSISLCACALAETFALYSKFGQALFLTLGLQS